MSDTEGLEKEVDMLTDDVEDLEKQNKALKAENASLKKQWYTPVATLLHSGERGGFWVSLEDKQRLAKLPAGTTLFIMIDK